MMFHGTRYIPSDIFLFLDNSDLIALSHVNRQLARETRSERAIRRVHLIESVMHYFHTPHSPLFSLYHTFQDEFEIHVKRLFRFIPEWFNYIERNRLPYLDVSDPYYHRSCFYRPALSQILSSMDMIATIFMDHLSRNTTLYYCNLGMFHRVLSRERIEDAVRNHPRLYHIEMVFYSNILSPSKEPTSLYRIHDQWFEWRHEPPQN